MEEDISSFSSSFKPINLLEQMNRSKNESIFDWDSFDKKCALANIKAQMEDSNKNEKENLGISPKSAVVTQFQDHDSSSVNILFGEGKDKVFSKQELNEKN